MSNIINIVNYEGVLTVSSREVAKDFDKEHHEVLKRIHGYDRGDRHINGIIDDFDSSVNTLQYFIPTEYQDSSGKTNKEYMLTRDGFTLLTMGFTGGKALEWKLKYIDAFNKMEQSLKQPFKNLSPQLQLLINIEMEQKRQSQEIVAVNQRIDGIKDVVSLNTQSWREDARKLIARIAQTLGSNGYIQNVTAEIYDLVEQRGGFNLQARLTNKRRRMADEGVCKSTRDRLSKVDVIAEDKKLIEIYVAIVKEMAIKYGVDRSEIC